MTEPLFHAVRDRDAEVDGAHALAASTIGRFRSLIAEKPEAAAMAKLRFRDPDLSESQARDAFFYLWLSDVVYHDPEGLYSGAFFEVPDGFEKWHAVGSRLAFDPEDVFDWMIIEEGTAFGGFTLRLQRERLPESRREDFDSHIGVRSFTAELT